MQCGGSTKRHKSSRSFSHPNIIPIYDVGQHEGQPYFAMGLAVGGSLAQHLDRFSARARDAVALVEKIARAVDYAHRKGVLHRDLKPANILLDERMEPLVSDFGIAKLLDSDVHVTQTGDVIGTPAYMAPEQAAGQIQEIGPATDVWALGVILYELLLAQRRFSAENKEELRKALLDSSPPARARCAAVSTATWRPFCSSAWRSARRPICQRPGAGGRSGTLGPGRADTRPPPCLAGTSLAGRPASSPDQQRRGPDAGGDDHRADCHAGPRSRGRGEASPARPRGRTRGNPRRRRRFAALVPLERRKWNRCAFHVRWNLGAEHRR